MDPTSILQALAGMAMAPGNGPPGADRYSNPYMWSPLTDRSLAPAMANNQMMQMAGMFAPIIAQMFAPELAPRIQAMSNIHPGLAGQARRMQHLQTQFSRAQSTQQVAAITAAFGPETAETAGKYLPMISAFMPGLNNALSRFDVSGAGFGYDAAMMSMARAGGLSTNRIDTSSATSMAKLYAEQYQREGKGLLAGTKVIDVDKTQGLTIAEMAQMRAGLTARGIVGDAYAGSNDAERIRAQLSEEDRRMVEGATSLSEMRQRGLTTDKIDTARKGVYSENLAGSAATERKYAEVVHKMGSVFTTMQGSTEELLQMVEKLHGPLAKLNTDDLEKTMTKFIKMMDASGLQAEELAKGIEVFKARTGVADTSFAAQAVAQSAGARRGALRSGSSEEGAMRIASETADALGRESDKLIGRGMGAFLSQQGIEALKKAEATLADPNASIAAREDAARFLRDPTQVAGAVDDGKMTAALAYRQRALTGQVHADEIRARTDATSERMGVSKQDRAELGVKVAAGSLLTRLGSTLRAVDQTDAGKAAIANTREQVKKWLGRDPTEDEMLKFAAVAVAKRGGGDAVAHGLAAMGIAGEKAAEIKESVLAGGLDDMATAIGATDDGLVRDLTAGLAGSIDTKQANAMSEKEIAEQWRDNKVARATNAATAMIGLLEGGKDKMGFKDFIVGGLSALGVLAPERAFSADQIKAIEEGGFGREFKEIQGIKDEDEKKRRMRVLASNISQELHLGDQEVENYLGDKAHENELVDRLARSKTDAEKTKSEAETRAQEKLDGTTGKRGAMGREDTVKVIVEVIPRGSTLSDLFTFATQQRENVKAVTTVPGTAAPGTEARK